MNPNSIDRLVDIETEGENESVANFKRKKQTYT
jgi:hypothetical protein